MYLYKEKSKYDIKDLTILIGMDYHKRLKKYLVNQKLNAQDLKKRK